MKQILLMIAVVLVGGCGGKKGDGNTGVVNPNKPSPKAVPVNIDNPIVEETIREELTNEDGEWIGESPKGKLTKADLEKVTELYLAFRELTEVPKGLEKLDQLKTLFLNDNKLTDVTGLEKLDQLKTLYLHDNKLADVDGLEKLTELTHLYLGGNQLASVKGLENLTQLQELDLNSNQLTNVKGLENLTQLEDLSLGGSQLTKLPEGLEKLTQLKKLRLYDNKLIDVTGLEKLDQLELLNLYNNDALTKAQIDQLQKALPKCFILSNPTK